MKMLKNVVPELILPRYSREKKTITTNKNKYKILRTYFIVL